MPFTQGPEQSPLLYRNAAHAYEHANINLDIEDGEEQTVGGGGDREEESDEKSGKSRDAAGSRSSVAGPLPRLSTRMLCRLWCL